MHVYSWTETGRGYLLSSHSDSCWVDPHVVIEVACRKWVWICCILSYRPVEVDVSHHGASCICHSGEENFPHFLSVYHTHKSETHSITVRNIYESFTHKMAAKASWHRYGTKLRHCHPMYSLHRFRQWFIWNNSLFLRSVIDITTACSPFCSLRSN